MSQKTLIHAISVPKTDKLWEVSNPITVQKKAFKYDDGLQVYKSFKPDKKYMILNPETNKFVYFGSIDYEDFTKHKDEDRQQRYLRRATNMRGNWRDDKYSPNNLSIHLLW